MQMIFWVSTIKEEVHGKESEFKSIADAVLLPMRFWEMSPAMKDKTFRMLINFLILLPTSVSLQVTLTESGGGIKRPGDTLQLTCTVSFDLTSYRVSWIRQPPGKGLEWMGIIWAGGSTTYNSGLQSRISITRATNKRQVSLQLSSLKPEDTSMYYCARGTERKSLSKVSKNDPGRKEKSFMADCM
ncbi:UNVERIFIED_CONTAM: hypothetical protein K2H54_044333 [Gekko kuhli]